MQNLQTLTVPLKIRQRVRMAEGNVSTFSGRSYDFPTDLHRMFCSLVFILSLIDCRIILKILMKFLFSNFQNSSFMYTFAQ